MTNSGSESHRPTPDTPLSPAGEWYIREAAGDHELHMLIAAREEAIDATVNRSGPKVNADVLSQAIGRRKQELGFDITHPNIELAVEGTGHNQQIILLQPNQHQVLTDQQKREG